MEMNVSSSSLELFLASEVRPPAAGPHIAIKVSCFSSSMQANCAAMGFLPAVISSLKVSAAVVM